jgi:hypothetical protein
MKNITLRFFYSTVEWIFKQLGKAVAFVADKLESVEVWATAKKAKLL